MLRLRLATLASLAFSLTSCQNFATPSSHESLELDYPEGQAADLPNLAPGAVVSLSVRVLKSSRDPAPGVEVVWDDGIPGPQLQPAHAVSNANGVATTRWTLRALGPDQFSARRSVRAYVPGAAHSPIEYRIEVTRCTRNCGGGGS
jgi:hypothetical protein